MSNKQSMKLITIKDGLGKMHTVDRRSIVDRISVYGVHLKNQRVLMVRDSLLKRWELPGGGKRNEEKELKCLKREFHEETGCVIKGELYYLSDYEELFFNIRSEKAWRTRRKYYLVCAVSGRIRKQGNHDDVEKVKYIPLDSLNRLDISKNTKKAIKIALVENKKVVG